MISNSQLSTPQAIFVEQYVYGRSGRHPRNVLGGQYPVIEFRRGADEESVTVEEEILQSSFTTLWEYYSVSLEEYEKRDEREVFKRNLENLLADFSDQRRPTPVPGSSKAGMVRDKHAEG